LVILVSTILDVGAVRTQRRTLTQLATDKKLSWLSGRPHPRAVLTASYLLLLLLTTLVLRMISPANAQRVLSTSSTDVWHLLHSPVQVLVASALWLPGLNWWSYAAAFTAFMTPLERRVGAVRLLLVFASGHVLATLVTELPIGAATWIGWLPASSVHRLDVGASYGTVAVIGAYAGLLPVGLRRVVMVAATAWVSLMLISNPDMTAIGHAMSLLIGSAWWKPLGRAAEHRSRPTSPALTPPEPEPEPEPEPVEAT